MYKNGNHLTVSLPTDLYTSPRKLSSNKPVGRNNWLKQILIVLRKRRLAHAGSREGSHGVHQIIDLSIQQNLTVRRLETIDMVSGAVVPALGIHLVGTANHADQKVITGADKPELICGDA